MRQFRTLFRVELDDDSGVLYIVGEKGTHDYPALMVSREGAYVPISVSYGPIEVALRLHHDELVRTLQRMQPVDGLITTRQVGSSSAYLAMGLRSNGDLLLRPTLISDAVGHFSVNLSLPQEARLSFFDWLGVTEAATY